MNRDCKPIRELLALRQTGWTASERHQVESHLATCDACVALARAYAAHDRRLAALPGAALTAAQRSHLRDLTGFSSATLPRTESRPRDGATEWEGPNPVRASSKPVRSFRLSRVLSTAATLLVVAGLVLALAWLLSQQPGLRRALVAPAVTPTPSRTPGFLSVSTPTATSTPTPGSIAALLANPPAVSEPVEVDAYYAAKTAASMPGGPPPLPDQVACPMAWLVTLTDRPFPATLQVLNTTLGNSLPAGDAWLIAETEEGKQPGQKTLPDLPYHARLRGHLGDPVFAQCDNADRIFVVDQVVAVYEQDPPESLTPALKLPSDFAVWTRYHNGDLGYSLSYPPDWQDEMMLVGENVFSGLTLRSPRWPDYPVVVIAHPGETIYDQYQPSNLPPLLQGSQGWGVFEQDWVYPEGTLPDSQHLFGYELDGSDDPALPGRRQVAVLFSANGRTYELSLTFPTGFGASQDLLTLYTAIVESFRLDTPPGPTPTPPINQSLGPGPFITQDQALAAVQGGEAGASVTLIDARLVSEAEARRQAGACVTFEGHPDGVWLLQVQGTYEGAQRVMRFFVDAVRGTQLCGEELGSIEPTALPPGSVAPTEAPTSAAAGLPTEPPAPTSTPAPTEPPAPAATPAATPAAAGLPTPAAAGLVSSREGPTAPPAQFDETWTDTSPDGQWLAAGGMTTPPNAEDFYTELTVARVDGSVRWTASAGWSRMALGYTTPHPLHWSRDGRFLYWTNVPVPDGGCVQFINGGDLWRMDLADGQSTQVMPQVGWWLSLSPDEKTLAYMAFYERDGLVLRDLQTGQERAVGHPGELVGADGWLGPTGDQAGHIVWSPDGTALALTVAPNFCDLGAGWADKWSYAVLRVDVATLQARVLIPPDLRRFTTLSWPEPGRILVVDTDKVRWWLNAETGELTMAR